VSTPPLPAPLEPVFDAGAETTGWIGQPDAMLALPCQSTLGTTTERPVSFTNTMEGRRFGLMAMMSRRTWAVDFEAMDSRQANSLGVLVRDTTDPNRTLRWYPPDAATGNLFSPQATEWDSTPVNGQNAGVTKLPDGSLARVLGHIGSGGISIGDSDGGSEHVVVHPGVPVTFGIWALGNIIISGFWRDATGLSITNFTSGTLQGSGWTWHSYTFDPPATARRVSFQLFSASAYARPSVTWGTQAYDVPGRGAPKTVIHGLSEDLEHLIGGRWLGSLSATVTEVG